MNRENSGQPSRPQIFSDEIISALGEELVNQITDQLSQGLAGKTTPSPASTLSLELIFAPLPKEVLLNLINCTLIHLNPLLLTQSTILQLRVPCAAHCPNHQPHRYDKFQILQALLDEIQTLSITLNNSCDLPETLFHQLFLSPDNQYPSPDHCPHDLLNLAHHMVIQSFRTVLYSEYNNFAQKISRKINCIQSDLEFLAAQIKQGTINYPSAEQGIIEMADAAAQVAQAFFSEEEDFAQIFSSVDAVSDLIEDLSHIYQAKLKQLNDLSSLMPEGLPLPLAKSFTLPEIPRFL